MNTFDQHYLEPFVTVRITELKMCLAAKGELLDMVRTHRSVIRCIVSAEQRCQSA